MTAALAAIAALSTVVLPLFIGALLALRPLERLALRAAPWAPLPALLLALSWRSPGASRRAAILLSAELGVPDATARAFLLLTAGVWLAAGLYARAYLAEDGRRARFWRFFLLTEAGNIGLVVAGDVATFYCFYALMTFAAYGLIVHAGSELARRAGRVYLVMALLGEMLLLAAFLLIVGADINLPLAGVPGRVGGAGPSASISALVLVGFGVKAGAFLVHFWLPLAHPVAPTPASAVLSGAMIKAGVLGWLRFLPLGLAPLPGLGRACVVAGLCAVFGAAGAGVAQRDPKTVLAYSSISQMGFITAVLGLALEHPEVAPAAVAAVTLFAVHHAFVKAALFLGTGVAGGVGASRAGRALVWLGLLASAWSLAGAPLSSGALAKLALGAATELAPAGGLPLSTLLSAGAVGSTLLMVRFLVGVHGGGAGESAPSPGLWLPWGLLAALPTVLVVLPFAPPGLLAGLAAPAALGAAAWPAALGVAAAAAARRVDRRGRLARVRLPAGDLLWPLSRGSRALARTLAPPARQLGRSVARLTAAGAARGSGALATQAFGAAERWLQLSSATGWMLLLVLVALVVSLVAPR